MFLIFWKMVPVILQKFTFFIHSYSVIHNFYKFNFDCHEKRRHNLTGTEDT